MLCFIGQVYKYLSPIVIGNLNYRYKRFLADVELENGNKTTVYCPNTGSMMGLLPNENSSRICACSSSTNLNRKYSHTLEMIKDRGTWVGIHSALANKIVKTGILDGLVNDLQHFSQINSEITLGDHCKIDFEILWYRSDTSFTPPTTNIENDLPKRKKIKNQIENSNKIIERRILLEVKSVTLAIEDSTSDELRAQFPDCVSERAQKHCERLTDYVKRGGEAMILFLVQRDDCTSFSASQYDTKYGKLLNKALLAGVKILVYQCRLDPETSTITWLGDIPFVDVYQDIEKM